MKFFIISNIANIPKIPMKNKMPVRFAIISSATALCMCAMFSSHVSAAIIVQERFDYTGSGDLAGKNGGVGFSGAWANGTNGNFTDYVTTGLTFSDKSVLGGATTGIVGGVASTVTRNMTSPLAGTFYGSYLFNQSASTNNIGVAAHLIGGSTDNDNTASASLALDEFNTFLGGSRIEGTASVNSGTAITIGTTYLYLYQVTLGATTTVNNWILSAAQYDNFKTGDFDLATLNAATT